MNARKVVLMLVSAAALAFPFGASAAGIYKVSTTLSHKGKAFASPVVVLKEAVPGTIEVSGPDGYKLSVIVTAAGDGIVDVAAKVDSARGAMAPMVTVRLGQAADVAIGDLQLGLLVEPHGG